LELHDDWQSDRELFVPMRDGVRLSTDVYLPKHVTGKLPTILFRTPYGKGSWAVCSNLYGAHLKGKRNSDYWYLLTR
jgi:predicted acyl esterase